MYTRFKNYQLKGDWRMSGHYAKKYFNFTEKTPKKEF